MNLTPIRDGSGSCTAGRSLPVSGSAATSPGTRCSKRAGASSDQPQVEVNQRFALFYPELRPFFLEGQEIQFRKTSYSFGGAVSSRYVTVVGDFNGGDGIYLGDDPFLGSSAWGRLAVYVRPGTRLPADLEILSSRFVDPLGVTVFDVKIFRTRAYYQFSNRLMLRHILEHNTLRGTLGNNLLLTETRTSPRRRRVDPMVSRT